MDFKLLYKRLTLLVSRPSKFWSQVKEESIPSSEVRRSFLIPILILVSIASFAGTYLYSYNSLSIIYPLLKGLEYFMIFFITVELVVFLNTEIMGYLLKSRITGEIYKLVVYSLGPFMILMILTRLFSSLLFLNLLGIYGIIVLWKGVDILLGGDISFRLRITALISSSILIFYLGIRWIVSSLVDGLYFLIFG
jgi:hypothetical protein